MQAVSIFIICAGARNISIAGLCGYDVHRIYYDKDKSPFVEGSICLEVMSYFENIKNFM